MVVKDSTFGEVTNMQDGGKEESTCGEVTTMKDCSEEELAWGEVITCKIVVKKNQHGVK
jgi:hypothetical protein